MKIQFFLCCSDECDCVSDPAGFESRILQMHQLNGILTCYQLILTIVSFFYTSCRYFLSTTLSTRPPNLPSSPGQYEASVDRKQSLKKAKDLLAMYDSVGHVSQQFYSRVCYVLMVFLFRVLSALPASLTHNISTHLIQHILFTPTNTQSSQSSPSPPW